MAGYFILSTRKGDYRALAFQGSQVYACHAQLSGLLRTHLGQAHARLLAEPLMDPQGTAVDWYTSGPVQPLAELPAEMQEAVKTRLQGLLSDIEELAASLQTDSDPYKSLCGTIWLPVSPRRNACTPPSPRASPQARRSPCWSAGAWPFLPPRRRKASMQWEPRRSPPSRKRLSPAAHPAIRIASSAKAK